MDFIEKLKEDISDDSISLISQKSGENVEKTRAGIFAAIPAVLAGIMKNGSSGSTGLSNLLSSNASLTDGDSLLDRGQSMLGNLFGADTDSVTNAISDSSGISRQKASGVLAMAAPVILGAITRLMSSKGWSFTDLIRNLFENKASIASSLPGNLGSTFGLASLTPNLAGRFDSPDTSSRNVHYKEPASTGTSLWKWLIPLVLIALALWWLMGRTGCNERTMVETSDSLDRQADTSVLEGASGTISGSLNEAGDWVYDLGAPVKKKLPNGTEISIGENSVENKLINFIEDENKQVDKTTWFSFDRLFFETGKSNLKPESKDQLGNIAAIMKAYPNVKIKLGGYTDNTGDAANNKLLSNERAISAMNELKQLGVSADRMEAEGYGSEHPVGNNETPEGRAQNRRIDIRVTAK